MFERPRTFRGYALASPSIGWDDREVLGREAAYAATHDDLAATVVVTVGGHEHHTTVPPVAVGHALRVLFGAPGADVLIPPR